MISFQRYLSLLMSALLVMAIAVTIGSAQSKKKKRHTTRRAAAAKTHSSTAANGEPGVVSLADQYSDSSTQIIDPKTQSSSPTASITLPDETTQRLRDMQSRIKKLETANKPDQYETQQKRLLTNLDILTRAEQRSESLRKERFELVEKENSIRLRLDQIDIDARPDVIERSVATVGSLRPEELREAKRKSLEAERRNLQALLTDITSTRASLDQAVLRADSLVEKLRDKLEKDINDALDSDKPDQEQ